MTKQNPANSDNLTPQADTYAKPQDSDLSYRQCNALKKDGERCKAPAVNGEETCALHGPRGQAIRAKAVEASVEARQAKVEARKEADERAKLTLSQWFARVAAERAEQLARKAVDLALDGDTRALSIVLERVEGKVTDRLEVKAGDPFEMDAAELHKWLSEDAALPKPAEDKPE